MDEKELELFKKLVENTETMIRKMGDISDSIDSLAPFLEAIAHNVGR